MAARACRLALLAVCLLGLHGPCDAQFPFLAHNGYLEEDAEGEANLHVATLSLAAAQKWCVDHASCVGFTHVGNPTEDAVEYYFKDNWVLAVDAEEAWTSYKKEKQVKDDELPGAMDDGLVDGGTFRCEIQTCSG